MLLCRYTGPSLGRFLNAALRIAIETLQRDDLDYEGPQEFLSGSVKGERHDDGGLPQEVRSLPDLLLMKNGTHSFDVAQMAPRDADHWNFTRLHHHQIQVCLQPLRLCRSLSPVQAKAGK